MQVDKFSVYVAPVGFDWNSTVEYAIREGYKVISWRGCMYQKIKGSWYLTNNVIWGDEDD